MVQNRLRKSILPKILGKEIIITFVIVVGLVSITTTVRQIPLLYIPGYLIILGSDIIQSPLLPRVTGGTYLFFFGIYLYGIAVVFGNLYRWARRQIVQE